MRRMAVRKWLWVGVLRRASRFPYFVPTRSLLSSTALSLPFYAILARQHTGGEWAAWPPWCLPEAERHAATPVAGAGNHRSGD